MFVAVARLGLAPLFALAVAVLPLALIPAAARAQATAPPEIEAVTLHRLFEEFYSCADHFEGELQGLGDERATDCVVQGGLRENGRGGEGFVRPFRGDGLRNADWYGWNVRVLAPFDGAVTEVHTNPIVNNPGELGKPPASFITFRRDDGMHVRFAHVQDPRVREGDAVRAGQFVARVGNNGYGRNPHIHVGAWKDDTAYQIRWDLRSGAWR